MHRLPVEDIVSDAHVVHIGELGHIRDTSLASEVTTGEVQIPQDTAKERGLAAPYVPHDSHKRSWLYFETDVFQCSSAGTVFSLAPGEGAFLEDDLP